MTQKNAPVLHPMVWTEDAVDQLARAFADCPLGFTESTVEALHSCRLFGYSQRGQKALIALKQLTFEYGSRVEVVACAALKTSTPIQTRQIFEAIENTAQQMGADELTLMTRHPAIAAGAGRWGAHISGAVLYKKLSKGH